MYKYFIACLVALAACQQGYKADYEVKTELALIDTLQNQLNTIKTWLDFMPLADIQERKDIINHNLDYLKEQYKVNHLILNEEDDKLITEYNSYAKLYGRAIDSFKPVVMEVEELMIQLKTLKASAHSKDYEKATFLTYFNQEKKAVEKVYQLADKILRPIKETDLAYERTQTKIEAMAEQFQE
jgi:hypothetical protein